MAMDLTKFKKPTTKYLSEASKNPISKVGTEKQENTTTKVVKSEKIGRPTIGDEPISKRFSLAFTEKEYKTLKENAGKIPLASFIRDALKVAKVI